MKSNIKNDKNTIYTPYCPTDDNNHVHEYESSTKLAELEDDPHNHRVAGVTSHIIPTGRNTHVHAILDNTDYFDHNHEIGVITGPNIPIPNSDKHVHLVSGTTTLEDGHVHEFEFTTLVDRPLI